MNALETRSLSAAPGATGTDERVEIITNHLRAAGTVAMGRFPRLSDLMNLGAGFFVLHDAVLLDRTGRPTSSDTAPELWIDRDEIAFMGEPTVAPWARREESLLVRKAPRRMLFITGGHLVRGDAYLHEEACLPAFVESAESRFIPLTGVIVRQLSDRRLIARYPFGLVNLTAVVGVSELRPAPGAQVAGS
ncbi:MAG: hypothetical protein IVW53_15040 [Chloroflexi bacterium]|nr:hypothetical protein [Chloroflexota bacterium]